ncbi:ribonuclease III [Peptococcaceae bacterium SCADC1_2_3]|jgi:ribonuclease-3|nr:ribonuclease III [Peptococcaceae bacterium SCADC1_2_3]KFI36704.1 ribonuclease III [Peptococcaceae bacterium SCADC1_2_3]HBQ28451.1 ribonuclease III [Desulfotomaculum sp.]
MNSLNQKKGEDNFHRLLKQLSLRCNNENLYKMALTHGSFAYENRSSAQENNQRLEFLGDAVLELTVSDYLYRTYPNYTEGELTKLRATIVCASSVARVAVQLNLGDYLMMGRGEEKSGGRERPSILADAFEALLGAVYLDHGWEAACKFALSCLKPIIEDVFAGRLERDYKTELQEVLQRRSPEPVQYIILNEKGPPHNKIFTAAVIYCNQEIGRGVGYSKKEAESQAAAQALEKMNYGRIENKD